MASATNGVAVLRVGGNEYPLLFGRASVEEMARRFTENISGNGFRLFLDLVYSGMLNQAIRDDMPYPDRTELHDLVEQFYDEPDSKEQHSKIWETFEKSRWGSEFAEKMEVLKKKAEKVVKEMESQNKIGTDLDNTVLDK